MQPDGEYLAQYVPVETGTFTLTITLGGVEIFGSPWTVEIIAGDMSPFTSIASVSAPINMIAGYTYFFDIQAKDIYGNLLTEGDAFIDIFADFVDDSAYDSQIGVPDLVGWENIYGKNVAGAVQDNQDGTYEGQVTVFRAGEFSLSIELFGEEFLNSPFTPYLVTPSDLYAPNSVPVGFSANAAVNVESTFEIQGRDYYSNNVLTLISSISDARVEIFDATTNELVSVGTIEDHATFAGVYVVKYTPTQAGDFDLSVTIEGLHIQDSPFSIQIATESVTDAGSSTLVLVSECKTQHKAGDWLEFNIES